MAAYVGGKVIRNWVKKVFDLYDIDDLTVGGRCGCCGKWIADEIFPEAWTWGLCQECIRSPKRD